MLECRARFAISTQQLATGAVGVFGTAAAWVVEAKAGPALNLTGLAADPPAVLRPTTLKGLPNAISFSRRLLVGPSQELAARQLIVSVQPTQTSNPNN